MECGNEYSSIWTGLNVMMLFTPFVSVYFVIIILTFICTFIPIPTQTQKQYMLVVSITETIQLGKLTILLLLQEWKMFLACFRYSALFRIFFSYQWYWEVYCFQKKVCWYCTDEMRDRYTWKSFITCTFWYWIVKTGRECKDEKGGEGRQDECITMSNVW